MADLSRYAQYLPRELAPGWLQGPAGQAWLRGMGDLKDSGLDRLKEAVRLRFATGAPADALEALGWERLIERGPADSDAAYAGRLVAAWQAWEYSGTAQGVLRALEGAGLGTAVIEIANGLQYRLTGSPTALEIRTIPERWTCTSDPRFWSAFAVVLPADPGLTRIGPVSFVGTPADRAKLAVSTATPPRAIYEVRLRAVNVAGTIKVQVSLDAGSTWGTATSFSASTPYQLEDLGALATLTGVGVEFSSSSITVGSEWRFQTWPQAEVIRRIIRRWKSAFSTCTQLALACTGEVWGWGLANAGGGSYRTTWSSWGAHGTWNDNVNVVVQLLP